MTLNQLQQQFSDALLYKNELIESEIKEKNTFSNNELLQIYRNSFVMGVTEALAITYQHTFSLVGEAFFNAVARQFILQQPPQENNIISYGEGFSDFLQHREQLKSLPYIAEMARFEWLLEETTNAAVQTEKLDLNKLARVQAAQFADIIFQIPSHIRFFSSEQNIQHLYQMLINDQVQETDLNQASYIALKKKADFSVELICLSKDEFLLVKQISNQQSLGEIEPANLHQFLPALMGKHLLNGVSIKGNL